MRDPYEEEFDHQVSAWTVGQLRAAIGQLPDDLPITVITAEAPGSDVAGDEQVVISAAPWVNDKEAWDELDPRTAGAMRAKLAAGEVQPDHVEIGLEFPSGRYYRRRS